MHPSLRIIALIFLAIGVQLIQPWSLMLVGALVLTISLALYPTLLWRMLRRSRWLLLTLALIFAFTTPGEYVRGWSFAIAPTYEGVTMGLLQMGRVSIMLAGLTLLLGSTGRDALMAGIYPLMRPLKLVGLSPERFTARLWLTLHYVELAPLKTQGPKWTMLRGDLDLAPDEQFQTRLVLAVPALSWLDWLLMCTVAASLIGWFA